MSAQTLPVLTVLAGILSVVMSVPVLYSTSNRETPLIHSASVSLSTNKFLGCKNDFQSDELHWSYLGLKIVISQKYKDINLKPPLTN